MKAKKQDRHRRIIEGLRNSVTVRISELARQFGVTTETVRRDLKELGGRGLVGRTYGGAVGIVDREPDIGLRETLRVEERARVARKAAGLVETGEVLMIDPGSTTAHFARSLSLRDVALHVLTNCVTVAAILAENRNIRVILCPGTYICRENSVFGPQTVQFLLRFHADKAVIGASGVSPDGVWEANPETGRIKRTLIERSRRTLLLVDSQKFNPGPGPMERVCALADLHDIVVDRAPNAALRSALQAASVRIHVAR